MKAEEFRRLTAELEKLTPQQKQILTDRLRATGQAQVSQALIESRVGVTPICPHCSHGHVARWGKVSGLQRYRCGACRATFNGCSPLQDEAKRGRASIGAGLRGFVRAIG